MKIHPRHVIMREANLALTRALIDFEKQHGNLTSVEWLWVFQSFQNDMIGRLIKDQDAQTAEENDD